MTHMSSRSRSGAARGGFSLLEVIIALVILTVGILGVATLSATSIWQTRRGDDLTNSAIAAGQVLDAVAVMPFDSVVVGTYADTFSFGPAKYVVSWLVVDVTDSLAAGDHHMKRIVAVSGGGMTQLTGEQYELFIYDRGGS